MRFYFGEKDNAPVYDNAVAVDMDVVLGKPCYWCEIPIVDGDNGFLDAHLTVGADPRDETAHTEFKPVHRWCDMRQVIGSLAHQRGECFCVTGSHDQERAYEEELGLRTEAEMACKEFFLNTKGIHGRELTGNSSESTSGD